MPTTMKAPNPRAYLKKALGKRKRMPRPTWELPELLYPRQGQWTEKAYLELTDDGARVELVDGMLDLLPMPTIAHDRIVKVLFFALHAFVDARRLGEVFISTTKAKLAETEIRMPDILLILTDRLSRHTDQYFFGADLVMEVVSGDSKSRRRDLVEKRNRYAMAGISEYWIVDPKTTSIEVLFLDGKKYAVHGKFKAGQKAESRLLDDFAIDVSAALSGSTK